MSDNEIDGSAPPGSLWDQKPKTAREILDDMQEVVDRMTAESKAGIRPESAGSYRLYIKQCVKFGMSKSWAAAALLRHDPEALDRWQCRYEAHLGVIRARRSR